jgi:hypothetical protein
MAKRKHRHNPAKRSSASHHKRLRRKHRKHTMGMPPALAKWHREHSRGGGKKRRTRKSSHTSHHKSHKSSRRSRRGRKHSLGLLGTLLPTVPEAVSVGTAALYGKFEGDAAKDAKHWLTDVPAPLTTIGRSGNIALGAWIIGALTRQPLIRAGAAGLVNVAAYQYMRRPTAYTDKDLEFKLSGSGVRLGRRDPIPELVERHLQGPCDDDDDADDGFTDDVG